MQQPRDGPSIRRVCGIPRGRQHHPAALQRRGAKRIPCDSVPPSASRHGALQGLPPDCTPRHASRSPRGNFPSSARAYAMPDISVPVTTEPHPFIANGTARKIDGQPKIRATSFADRLTPASAQCFFQFAKSGSVFRCSTGTSCAFSQTIRAEFLRLHATSFQCFLCPPCPLFVSATTHAYRQQTANIDCLARLSRFDGSYPRASITRATHLCPPARKHVLRPAPCPGHIYQNRSAPIFFQESKTAMSMVNFRCRFLFFGRPAGPGACGFSARTNVPICRGNVPALGR